MDEETGSKDSEESRRILSPTAWFLTGSFLWALLIVPISIGFFYILRIPPRFFEIPNSYSPLFGLVIGFVLSALAGFFYSSRARKHAE